MPEPEQSENQKPPKVKGPRRPESLSARVERSLKDVDRLLKKNPDAPPQERAMAQLEQAKVSALLQLAEAIRETRGGDGPPRA
jgi:hypothetical protein